MWTSRCGADAISTPSTRSDWWLRCRTSVTTSTGFARECPWWKPDREPVPQLFELLMRALHYLNESRSPLLLAAFFWRLISVEGSMPQLEQCVVCEGTDGLEFFDVLEGGVHCRSCRSGVPVSAAALSIIGSIVGGRMNEALALGESTATHEVNRLAMESMESLLERRLKSLGVFDRHL